MMKSLLYILMTFGTEVALAAGEGGHHGVVVPTTAIFWQIFNLTILFTGMFFLLRQTVKDFFKDRRAQFIAAANKSQAARQEAEKQFEDIKGKIERLEMTRAESLARAEAEAADLRKQIIRDGEEMAKRIRSEASLSAQAEIQRAKRELHQEFVKEAVAAARMVLTKDVSGQDQQRLQTEFTQNIGTVNT